MDLTNLGQLLVRAFDAAKSITAPAIQPAKEKKENFKKMRQSGLSERQLGAKAKRKGKAKRKSKQKETETGEANAITANLLAPTSAKGMATVNGAITVASPTMDLKEEKEKPHQ
jgi:hypothetical protein